jgi:hypothetical protein
MELSPQAEADLSGLCPDEVQTGICSCRLEIDISFKEV